MVYESGKNNWITPLQQLLIALRFYGTFQLVVGDLAAVSRSTVCKSITQATHLKPRYMKMPEDNAERHYHTTVLYIIETPRRNWCC